MLSQIAIDEWRMYASRRNAIAADVVRDVVAGDRIGHRDYRAFAGGIGEAVCESRRARDRRHVENYPATVRLHLADAGANAIVVAFHVYAEYPVEIVFGRALDVADVRDACIVHQYPNWRVLQNLFELRSDFGLIGHVAGVRKGLSARRRNLCCDACCILLIKVDDVDRRAIGSKLQGNRPANATAGARDDGNFPVQLKLAPSSRCQRETPRFQGMKSSWFFCSALVRTSPPAT